MRPSAQAVAEFVSQAVAIGAMPGNGQFHGAAVLGDHDEGLVQQAAAVEVADQGRETLVEGGYLLYVQNPSGTAATLAEFVKSTTAAATPA